MSITEEQLQALIDQAYQQGFQSGLKAGQELAAAQDSHSLLKAALKNSGR